MTQEEFHIDWKTLSHEEFLKHLVRFSEERYIWYKKQLEWVFKDKETWPLNEELTVWYKEHLREWKNYREHSFKEHRYDLEVERGTAGYRSPKFITDAPPYEEKIINKLIENWNDNPDAERIAWRLIGLLENKANASNGI